MTLSIVPEIQAKTAVFAPQEIEAIRDHYEVKKMLKDLNKTITDLVNSFFKDHHTISEDEFIAVLEKNIPELKHTKFEITDIGDRLRERMDTAISRQFFKVFDYVRDKYGAPLNPKLCLFNAAKLKDLDRCQWFMKEYDECADPTDIMHLTLESGDPYDPETLKFILDLGADPNGGSVLKTLLQPFYRYPLFSDEKGRWDLNQSPEYLKRKPMIDLLESYGAKREMICDSDFFDYTIIGALETFEEKEDIFPTRVPRIQWSNKKTILPEDELIIRFKHCLKNIGMGPIEYCNMIMEKSRISRVSASDLRKANNIRLLASRFNYIMKCGHLKLCQFLIDEVGVKPQKLLAECLFINAHLPLLSYKEGDASGMDLSESFVLMMNRKIGIIKLLESYGAKIEDVCGMYFLKETIQRLKPEPYFPELFEDEWLIRMELCFKKLNISKEILGMRAFEFFCNYYREKNEGMENPLHASVVERIQDVNKAFADFYRTIIQREYFRIFDFIVDELGLRRDYTNRLRYSETIFNADDVLLLIRKGQTERCRKLIDDHGFDINTMVHRTRESRNCLRVWPETFLITAVHEENIDLITRLLELGANPNLGSSEAGSALDLARSKQNLEVGRLLLDYRARPAPICVIS